MRAIEEILRSLGRIEGELIEIRKLSERVGRLETAVAWIKGGWAAVAAFGVYLYRTAFGR